MSDTIRKFKLFIRFIVSIFASREFGFVYCIIGTLAQTAHTYFLVNSVSSLEGFWKYFQAFGLSIFISSSLLFFTAIADNDEDSADYKKIHLAVNLFMIIEIIINLYYYAAHLIINVNGTGENWLSFEYQNVFDFIFAILISCMIPVTIKLYAGIIQAKEWFESFEESEQQIDSNSLPIEKDFVAIINSEIDKREQSIIQKVSDDFQKNAEEFLVKIDSKIKSVKKPEFNTQTVTKSESIKPIVVEKKVVEENEQKDKFQDSPDLLDEF